MFSNQHCVMFKLTVIKTIFSGEVFSPMIHKKKESIMLIGTIDQLWVPSEEQPSVVVLPGILKIKVSM